MNKYILWRRATVIADGRQNKAVISELM